VAPHPQQSTFDRYWLQRQRAASILLANINEIEEEIAEITLRPVRVQDR
jgi:hypothetical protein